MENKVHKNKNKNKKGGQQSKGPNYILSSKCFHINKSKTGEAQVNFICNNIGK